MCPCRESLVKVGNDNFQTKEITFNGRNCQYNEPKTILDACSVNLIVYLKKLTFICLHGGWVKKKVLEGREYQVFNLFKYIFFEYSCPDIFHKL